MTSTLSTIRQRIDAARAHFPLAAKEVTLIAASKTQGPDAILPLLDAGHRDFGENYVQEAAEKWPALLARYPEVRLHLIGGLQSNKVREAVELFDVIHSVDRISLVAALRKEMARLDVAPAIFLQVNTGDEAQKNGCTVAALPSLLADAREGLNVRGLMAVPPASDNPAPHFALLYQLASEAGLSALSIGMSADLETAIRFGATHLRVGTALFGARG